MFLSTVAKDGCLDLLTKLKIYTTLFHFFFFSHYPPTSD